MEVVKTITKKDIVVLEERAVAISKKANFKVTSQETLKDANEVMDTLKTAEKFVAEKKASIIGPLNIALRNTRELFRPIEEKIDSAKWSLKTKVLAYKKQVDETVKKQQEKIAKKVEKGETTFKKASEKMEKIEEKTSEFKTRKVREIEITDEKQIPRGYYKLDMVLLRKDALGGKEIPGVKVIEKEIAIM